MKVERGRGRSGLFLCDEQGAVEPDPLSAPVNISVEWPQESIL